MRWPGVGVRLAVAVVAAAGVAAGLVISGSGSGSSAGGSALPTDASGYENVDACLLTGADGVTGAAAPVWAGMEDASRATTARASYLEVSGPATEGNAMSFLGTLVLRGCRVIVASGAPERAVVLANAGRFAKVRFVVTGAAPVRPNVTAVAFATSGLRAAVASAVESGVRAAGG